MKWKTDKTLHEIVKDAIKENKLDFLLKALEVADKYHTTFINPLRKTPYEKYVTTVWEQYSSRCIDKIMDDKFKNSYFRFIKKEEEEK